MKKNGTLSINGQKVTEERLEQVLTSILETSPTKNVVIRADRDVELKRAVTVIDAAKKAEASGIVISTQERRHDQ